MAVCRHAAGRSRMRSTWPGARSPAPWARSARQRTTSRSPRIERHVMTDHSATRRIFLKSSAASLAAGIAPAFLLTRSSEAASAGVLDRLGVALYTVRDQMKADAAGTLKAIAG